MYFFKKAAVVFFVLVCISSCKIKGKTEEHTKKESVGDLTQHVNPFIGTAPLTDPAIIGYTPPEDWRVWAGLVYPGSALPNAMVQLSPITEYGTGAGYEYEDTKILGFTHTNKGHWNLCNIPILPLTGKSKYPFSSSFSHEREEASPGYYQVFLEDYGVDVRLTSALRSGVHEYTFEDKRERKILFDLGRANNRVSDWTIQLEGSNSVSGFQKVGGDQIHFYATLNQPIIKVDWERDGEPEGYAVLTLQDGGAEPVLLKIGLSYVSSENARANLEMEIGNSSFQEVHEAAKDKWQSLLSTIEVSGGNEKQTQLFYTSLYRSSLWPALRSDYNGDFRDLEGNVQNEGFRYYTNPSFWDTYRNKLVLLTVISPDVTEDVIKSLIHKGEISGFIPTFFHGDHAAPFIAGAYKRGVTGFDVKRAYKLLLNNAYKEGGTRPYIAEYIEKGYISDPEVQDPVVETKGKAGVSKTLEYAYDDYSLAILAKELGDSEKYQDLMLRSQNYKNVFDTTTNFMRGRLENGAWISPFDPQYPYYEYMYREANAWQVSFFAPHDMPGLVELYGGREKFEQKLDSLFTYPWNPNHIARNVSGFIGQYSHGNQPDHEAPFSYYFVDKPAKSQAVIDNILENYYGIGDEGLALAGMDDAGEMSSWYVFSSLGLYPLSPADDEYLVTVPLFDEVRWNLSDNKQLVLKKSLPGRRLVKLVVNGRRFDNYFVPHNLFEEGGQIEIITEE